MAEKMSICVFSGTVDKMFPVATLASGAVAMDMEVDIFLTFWGILAFKKDVIKTNKKFSKEFEEMAPELAKKMEEKKTPPWYETLKKAKEIGDVRIHACSTVCDLMDIKKEDLDELVDDIVGVGNYVAEASDAKITTFI